MTKAEAIMADMLAMSDEEFFAKLKEHENGDIALMLRHEWERMALNRPSTERPDDV